MSLSHPASDSSSRRIDILAIGSRGDVQPFIALGLGLARAGHRVRIVTLGGFEEFVGSHGLEHVAIGDSPQQIAATEAGQRWIRQRTSVIGFVRGGVRLVRGLLEDGLARYWRVCGDTEVLVTTIGGLPLAIHVAEKLNLPLIRAQTMPTVPSRYDWSGKTSRSIRFRNSVEAMGWTVFRNLHWLALRGPMNRARRRVLGLPALSRREPIGELIRRRVPLIDGYSPAVVPRPPDWGGWIHVTGYWFLDHMAGWTPPEELVEFLDAGPAPVFVGFGSTPFPRPRAATRLVVEALTAAGQRGLVVAGGSGLEKGRLADGVFSIDSVPHGWLFPRMCAAVHHGGAGVTGAALRAGLASVVVPIFADQPFWARRVFELGVGPRPIPAKRLRAARLADAIRLAVGREMRQRAAALGERIRREDGVARAVEAVDHCLAGPTCASAPVGNRAPSRE